MFNFHGLLMLVKFRFHQVALSCDMEKMFLQIKVVREHQDLQRVYWRTSDQDTLKVYRLTRLIFGLTNSPYTAMRCVRQLAQEFAEIYPRASEVLCKEIFMDDILTGAESVEDAVLLRNQLVAILKEECFPLSKWCSNTPSILPEDAIDSNPVLLSAHMQHPSSTKVLGLMWDPNSDAFRYEVQPLTIPNSLSKREVLSSIAKLFDPIGIISPVVVKAKILMQRLTVLPLGWEDEIPEELRMVWAQIAADLPQLNHLEIPRKIIPEDSANIELIAFADASLQVYGAAIYLRSQSSTGNYTIRMICSRSRVSPTKVVSLPRLELCAALLAAQLMQKVSEGLNLMSNKRYYFSDSMVTLHYIKSDANCWQVYVANRVSKIQSLCNPEDWYCVNTKENPADILSRGVYPRQLLKATLFWNGPEFLTNDASDWPSSSTLPAYRAEELPERRKVVLAVAEADDVGLPVLRKFSTYHQTQRTIALCLRFVHNIRNPGNKRSGALGALEMNEAHKAILKAVQSQAFPEELDALQKGQQIGKKCSLLTLDPYLDDDRLIRVGGRLRNAEGITEDKRHPIALPHNSHISQLLIRLEHLLVLHAGPNQTLAAVRSKYWPLRARSQVRNVIHACMSCCRVSPRMFSQKMGDLPKDRLNPCRPFTNVGLDYFGPVYVKVGAKRSNKLTKTWVALFVCMFTKAVHLEVVGDLTSDSFLNALKRLISRRGRVARIFCDNAKTFVGAKNELDHIPKFLRDSELTDDVASYLANEGIIWEFIPPRSPNFGGLWERLVKSAKLHFKKVTLNANLTFEEAVTLTTQIEACMNSRPLCPLSNDPAEYDFLTPGHFLIGESLLALPEYDLTNMNSNRLSRWQRVQQMTRHFWNRWRNEVLTMYQPRSKWCQTSLEKANVGDLVLISDENSPPLQWTRGRIQTLYPGPDGLVRVAEVKTKDGVFKRSIRKLALLPIEELYECEM